MITLLMALFMVLFSISSVNISKYQTLQKSLKAAFSGNILPGGKDIAQQGSTVNAAQAPTTVELQALEPLVSEGSSSLQNSTAHGASASAPTASTAGAPPPPAKPPRNARRPSSRASSGSSTPTRPRTASPRACRPRSKRAAW